MNLRGLSDEVLLSETKRLVKEERELLTVILHHLREVDRRRLFSTLKYGSIHEYAMKELNYSQDQAGRRVAASRLLRELPEIEEKINSGALNLTTLGLAQTLFQREKREGEGSFSKEKKIEVIEKLEHKTTREAQRIVWSFSSLPQPVVKETVRAISEDLFEYNFAASQQTQGRIERLKGLLAHSNPGISLGELIEKLCELGLEEWDPGRRSGEGGRARSWQERRPAGKGGVAAPRPEVKKNTEISHQPLSQISQSLSQAEISDRSLSQAENPDRSLSQVENSDRSLSRAEISRQVWRRAQSQCERCGSYYALQEDHRFPRAMGGPSTAKNMRLLCRFCNQRAAIEVFGLKKMEPYLT